MSSEREELLETLYSEKVRYQHLERESMSKLLELSVVNPAKLSKEQMQDRERIEEEIQMVRNLISYIDFKLKVLDVNEFAS